MQTVASTAPKTGAQGRTVSVEGKTMFDFLVQVEGGGSGSNGGLPSSVCDAGSLEVNYHSFDYVSLCCIIPSFAL